MRTSPESSSSKPLMQRSNVVLPQPEGPSRVTNSPALTARETSSSAVTVPPSGAVNRLTASSTSATGEPASGDPASRIPGNGLRPVADVCR